VAPEVVPFTVTETDESFATRVNKASYEISFKNHFNEVIVNDDLQKACFEAEQVIRRFLGEQLNG